MTATMDPRRLTAYEWHGGGGSPLYSFASTGGIVHSEEHRADLITEIEEGLKYVNEEASIQGLSENDMDRDAEIERLNTLLAHVKGAPVGEMIEDPKDAFE